MPIASPESRRAQVIPAVVAIVVYLAAVRNGFAYDDVAIIVRNARIHHWATLLAALGTPYWYGTGHLYRPLTTLAFGLEWILSQGSPAVFHVVNIVWHAVVSALVARLTLRWWSPTAALCAGLWFAIHPVHVEAVANVVGRSELVCAAALIGVALVASAQWAGPRSGHSDAAVRVDSPLLLVALLSAIALASKESGAAAPVIAWAAAWSRTPTSPSTRSELSGRAWQFAGVSTVAIGCMIGLRYAVLGSMAGDEPHPAFLVAATRYDSLLLALASLPRAVGLMLVPQLPRPDYSPTDVVLAHPNLGLVACGAVLIGVGLAIIAIHMRRPTPWTFAGVFTVATFAPVSNVVVHTGVVIAERTLYSPSIGVALIVGAGAAALWQRIGKRSRVAPVAMARLAMGVAMAVFVVASLVLAETSIPIWKDSPTVFAAIRERAPTSYRGYYLEADAERDRGEVEPAHRDYSLAFARFSGDLGMLHHAGLNALAVRDTAAAIGWLSHALSLDSTQLTPRTALAQLYLHRGDTVAARKLLQDGVRIEPDQRVWRQLLVAISSPPLPAAAPLR